MVSMENSILPEFLAFKARPGIGTRFLIKKNAENMINTTLNDILTWTINTELRYKFLYQLYNLILCCEDGITPYTGKIINMLYRNITEEEKNIREISMKIAYAIGFYVSPNVFVPIFANDFQQKVESADSNSAIKHITKSALLVITEELKATTKEEIAPHLPILVEILNKSAIENEPSLIPDILLMALSLIITASEFCKDFRSPLFHTVLNLTGASPPKSLNNLDSACMEILAKNCGLDSKKALFSVELGSSLKFYLTDYQNWVKNSLHRFSFDTLIRNSKEAVFL